MRVQIMYINMDKRTDRRQRMEDQLQRLSIPFSRRIGVECTFNEIGVSFRKGVIPSIQEYGSCLINSGNFGCYLSHVAVLREIGEADAEDVFIVFEDDVEIVVKNFEERIDKILHSSDGFDMIYLYIPPHRLFVEPYSHMCYRMRYGYEGLYAYAIRPAYARVLLSELSTFKLPVDHQVMQCNDDRQSVILTPIEPLVWTDCSFPRDSDTLRSVTISPPTPLYVHSARALSALETRVFRSYQICQYPSWCNACKGMEDKGGVLLPSNWYLKREIQQFVKQCEKLAFGSDDGGLYTSFLAGTGFHHVEEMIERNDLSGQDEIQWIDPVLAPYFFSTIDGRNDCSLRI